MHMLHCYLVLLSVQIYLNIALPILPYKHDAFNLSLMIALELKAVLHIGRLCRRPATEKPKCTQ